MSERAILAAQGYLELGMAEEALAELSTLTSRASIPTSSSCACIS